MSWEHKRCILRIVLKHREWKDLFSNLTLQPNDTICTSFVNIVKATYGTIKISVEPGEKMSIWKV